MKNIGIKVISAATGITLLAPAIAVASTSPADTSTNNESDSWTWTHVDASHPSGERTVANVQGDFGYTQDAITSNDRIAAVFNRGAAALCDAATELTIASPSDWAISVTGDVANAYSATLAELESDELTSTVMGCSCASNGVGGLAAINAEVTGVPLASVIEKAEPNEGVNVVTLVSEDGRQIKLPLAYVLQRKAVVASQINNESLSESVGGTNQLWIDSTAAKYFARNIVEIRLETMEDLPSDPGSEMPEEGEYVNRPNVGITGTKA
ncbi:MAG: molybdopterin-dependent oxidoreductase [Slackia sp.]|nr:molybdopterin-dependent oxidoreductase [Slackia sp.]